LRQAGHLRGAQAVLADISAGWAPLTMAGAAKHRLLAIDGAAPAPSTPWRWGKKGTLSVSGQLVRLEIARIGGVFCTTEAAIERFFQRLNAADPDPPVTTASQLRRAHEHAEAALDSAGIK
jgi:hypothetical protein